MYKDKTIGVVILAYEVEGFIENVIRGLPDFVGRVYVVDDGSRDRTAEIVKNMIETENIKRSIPGESRAASFSAAAVRKAAGRTSSNSQSRKSAAAIKEMIIPTTEGTEEPGNGNNGNGHNGDKGKNTPALDGDLTANYEASAETIQPGRRKTITLISHESNRGPGAALKTGYRAAIKDNVEITAKVDGDGQMPLEYLEPLIEPIAEGIADYTKGNRFEHSPTLHGMSRFRKVGNYLLTWLTRLASGYWRISDTQNGFIAISNRALKTIDLGFCSYYGYLNDILARLNVHNFRVMDIAMPAIYRDEKSKINYLKFIPRVSLILLRIFFWRLLVKYLKMAPRSDNKMASKTI